MPSECTALEAAADTVLVPGYRHLPGNHCGSTALRNLLAHHGLPYSEAMAFGLGAGACFFYVSLPESPTRFTNGRTARLEEQFVELTGAPLRLQTAESAEESWRLAREVVDSGRPALLLTDLYYLDHYGRSAHFPGHAVVLAGYDAERAYLSDTGFEELQATSLESLAKARHAQHPAYPLAGHMLHLPPKAELADLRNAVPAAVARAAEGMLEPALADYQGLPALRRLAAEVEGWPEELEDWSWCARFAYQVIERRGTGGGNFRRMYGDFLEEAGYEEAARARAAAESWTELAGAFYAASESEQAKPDQWRQINAHAARVVAAEERLWTDLATAPAG